MNLLGGMGLEWWFLVEWLHKAMVLACVSHLWYATQAQGIWRPSVEKAYSATTWQYGLCHDHIGC